MTEGGARAGPSGLTGAEAAARLRRDGPNEVAAARRRSVWAIVGRELADTLGLALLAAGLASILVLHETLEGAVILAIVALNVALSTGQQWRADKASAALRRLAAPTAQVVRDGRQERIPAREVVVGDLVLVAAGDRVPADLELVEAQALAADESLLTGESLPVGKAAGPGAEARLHAGTTVVRGRGRGVVAATGAATRLGAIATGLEDATAPPLERELKRVTFRIGLAALAAGLLLLGLAALRAGRVTGDAVLAAVALAVAAVPESLLAVVSLALALGVQRMARRGTIVRRLRAVEGLGAVTVLCVDKTGTLTEGRLAVARHWAAAAGADALWRAAQRCNDAEAGHGDPLEVALLEAARAAAAPAPTAPRVAEEPFDAATRRMATVHATPAGPVLTVKGAPEAVLSQTSDAAERATAERLVAAWAAEGLRVLALADAPTADLRHPRLRLLGLVAFQDPVRASAPAALAACRAAGIQVVLVTGDHPATARSVAASVGLDPSRTVTGAELAALPEAARAEALRSAEVVARVEPGVKVALVAAHQEAGAVVAMMGDGVNDAPALRRADVGVAVAGDRGTDVAREAASVVLTAPDLDTLVGGVREGRALQHAVAAVVAYLLAGNASEVLVTLGALVAFPDLALPFTAVQLLWVNLVTDGLPALALGADRPPGDPLRRPQRRGAILSGRRLAAVAARGLLLALLVLASGWAARRLGAAPAQVQAQLLLSLVTGHVVMAYASRGAAPFAAGWWRNRTLLAAVAASLALQALVSTVPPLRLAFHLAAPAPAAFPLAAGVAAAFLALVTAGHGLRRARKTT